MVRCIERVQTYTRAVSYAEFGANQEKIDAVVRNLELIGEAAGRVPGDVRDRYPAIPWATMRAMRNILAHGYYAVDLEIIWGVVEHRLAPLSHSLREILREQE